MPEWPSPKHRRIFVPEIAPETIPALEIYKQQYAHFGRMNELLYKLPTLHAALIGGLWYFAYTALAPVPLVAAMVFLFAAIVCRYSLTFTAQFRLALNKYLDRINAFEGANAVTLRTPEQIQNPKVRRPLSSIRALGRSLWWAFGFSLFGCLYALTSSICKLNAVLPFCTMIR
jgi:hypothetical protein